jgi:hypothetical protein
MTVSNGKKQEWRGFLKTIDLLTAAALEELEAQAGHESTRWERKFEVVLLAAASAEGIRLPESEVLSQGSELGVTITPGNEQLFLKLQLQGFATLDQFGGREARLVSENGAIDYRFRFAASGQAICILADRLSVREGLGKFAILFQEGDGESHELS